jgi:hypothetical protein
MLAMAISLPEMLASMLVLAISLLGMTATMLVLAIIFYLGWRTTCQCWPSVLPGIVVNMPLLAISFTWDGGQHASVAIAISLPWIVAITPVLAIRCYLG